GRAGVGALGRRRGRGRRRADGGGLGEPRGAGGLAGRLGHLGDRLVGAAPAAATATAAPAARPVLGRRQLDPDLVLAVAAPRRRGGVGFGGGRPRLGRAGRIVVRTAAAELLGRVVPDERIVSVRHPRAHPGV